MTELRYEGRIAIVTGAGRGIGREHALLLASRGAAVVVSDLGSEVEGSGSSSGPADEVVDEIVSAGGTAVASYASVSEEKGAQSIVETAVNTFGAGPDIVINNAGIYHPGPFLELTLDRFEAMMRVHFFGAVMLIQAAWAHMASANYGRIVNTVSEAMLGITPQGEVSDYGAAKAALFGLTRNLAVEGSRKGIKVNCIAPRAGTRMVFGRSEMVASVPEEVVEQMKAAFAPRMVSPAAAYLAHESCRLNGEMLQVGGGTVARVAVVQAQGYSNPLVTLEDVATNIDVITDLSEATPVEIMSYDPVADATASG
jgi:NAD(P)-dependent dehydrogenase (short-subunit alcohol dehydrogenase family)